MSTDRKKRTRSFLQSERFRIIEYACAVLVVLLFFGLAVWYGVARSATDPDAAATASPEPSADTSIRGMNVLNALEGAGVDVVPKDGLYTLTAPNGVPFDMRMESDDRGIVSLSFETLLCPDPSDDSAVSAALREQNELTVSALRDVFDAVMPAFHRSAADSETIVAQCQKVVKSGAPYAKRLGDYSVRVLSDPDAVPQSVCITLIRDR